MADHCITAGAVQLDDISSTSRSDLKFFTETLRSLRPNGSYEYVHSLGFTFIG